MPNKQLTAKVRLNTTQAERSINNLVKKINKINTAVNGIKSDAITRNLNKTNATTGSIVSKVKEWSTHQRNINSSIKSSNSLLGGVGRTLKGIAATYLGMMGARAVMNTSDTITSAENRLNNMKGGSPELTSQSMDKMYAAAQRARTGYDAMLSNVSKTMTLAGDAFQGNIDNAIRFQEIMAKAYTIGGASAEEMSTSMYQLVQALGSGVLQGDELRSVREGAPIAYKKIEEFAQGVLDTEKSLKDLASQGLITSDIIVAAIMGAENEITKSFNNTKTTFAQTLTTLKNTAIKAFEPVLQKLNDALNSDTGQAMIQGISNALVMLANATLWLMDTLGKFFNWCADNWGWLKHVIIGALIAIMAYQVAKTALSIACAIAETIAWIKANWQLAVAIYMITLVITAILALLYIFLLWKQGALNTIEAISNGLLVLAAMFALMGLWMIAIPLAALALITRYFAEFCGFVTLGLLAIGNAVFWCVNLALAIVNWGVALLYNILAWYGNVFHACINWMMALWHNFIAGIVNLFNGCVNVLGAGIQNIGIWWNNICASMTSAFWNFIASCLEGISGLAPVIESVASAFGKEISISAIASNARGRASAADASKQEYVSYGAAWNSGMSTMSYQDLGNAWDTGMQHNEYKDLGEAWNKGWNTYDVFEEGWAKDAYDLGYAFGSIIEDKVNGWGSQFQNKTSKGEEKLSLLQKIQGALGKYSGIDPNDSKYNLGGGYNPSGANDDIAKALDKLGNIDDNTGSMKDAMELAEEDLAFLRKLADMEWKKEYTTASIVVEMNNENNINGEADLDGLVTKLSDKLYEELNIVANGVYA